jgi:hypothetical protein
MDDTLRKMTFQRVAVSFRCLPPNYRKLVLEIDGWREGEGEGRGRGAKSYSTKARKKPGPL